MKFIIETDPKKDPNRTGECLREEFFDQSGGEYGCYSTFDYCVGVKALPKEPDTDWEPYPDWSTEDDRPVYTCAEKTIDGHLVKMRYFWDGDGVLEFVFPDGSRLENTDCKKDDEWVFKK